MFSSLSIPCLLSLSFPLLYCLPPDFYFFTFLHCLPPLPRLPPLLSLSIPILLCLVITPHLLFLLSLRPTLLLCLHWCPSSLCVLPTLINVSFPFLFNLCTILLDHSCPSSSCFSFLRYVLVLRLSPFPFMLYNLSLSTSPRFTHHLSLIIISHFSVFFIFLISLLS